MSKHCGRFEGKGGKIDCWRFHFVLTPFSCSSSIGQASSLPYQCLQLADVSRCYVIVAYFGCLYDRSYLHCWMLHNCTSFNSDDCAVLFSFPFFIPKFGSFGLLTSATRWICAAIVVDFSVNSSIPALYGVKFGIHILLIRKVSSMNPQHHLAKIRNS